MDFKISSFNAGHAGMGANGLLFSFSLSDVSAYLTTTVTNARMNGPVDLAIYGNQNRFTSNQLYIAVSGNNVEIRTTDAFSSNTDARILLTGSVAFI
jgi:hypothetical protein